MAHDHITPESVADYVANRKLKTEDDVHNLPKRWQILQDILAKDKQTYDRQLSSFGERNWFQYVLPWISTQPMFS